MWVNGKYVACSTASAYNPHTFDITDFLTHSGENKLNSRSLKSIIQRDFFIQEYFADFF
ncbi:MAG: hypothetical protein ACK5IJ_07890 [Mangrovibacterium sp.]